MGLNKIIDMKLMFIYQHDVNPLHAERVWWYTNMYLHLYLVDLDMAES